MQLMNKNQRLSLNGISRRSVRSVLVGLFAGAMLSFVGGCENDPNQTKLQYMPDMVDGPVARAQRDYLDPPEGSVPVNAILYPDTPDEAEKLLQNPYKGRKGESQHIAKGKKLYETFCTVCHGTDAKGGGTIVDKFPRPPDITLDMYKNRADGFYFHRITFGSALMPGYGYAISPHERWQIVMYLRTLQ